MTAQLSARHYCVLSAHERFVLQLEAMARGDERESDRLEDTCPRLLYRAEDAAFRDRMGRAYMIASRASLNMRDGLAQLRLARAIREHSASLPGPLMRLAQGAFLFGRAYGKWEAGATEGVARLDAATLVGEVAANPDLLRQLEELRDVAKESVREMATTVLEAGGDMYAVDLLSQWEGFSRFCCDTLNLEPVTVLRAFGLDDKDIGAEVRAAFPEAQPDHAAVTRWQQQWTHNWVRRFG